MSSEGAGVLLEVKRRGSDGPRVTDAPGPWPRAPGHRGQPVKERFRAARHDDTRSSGPQ